MQRISFRSFIIFCFVAAVVICAGVVLYWTNVNTILERDVKSHIAQAGEDAALDFNRALEVDHNVLSSISLTVEEFYPWKNALLLQFLDKQARHYGYEVLGVIDKNETLFLSHKKDIRPDFLRNILEKTQQDGHYLEVQPVYVGDDTPALVQSVPLYKRGEFFGVLFFLQNPTKYRPLLALTAIGNKGYSFVVRQDGSPVLGYRDLDFDNIFSLLSKVTFDLDNSLLKVEEDFAKGFNSMVGYRFNDEHRFLHYIPLERNNWYMMSSIPTQFVVMQAQRLTGLSLVLFGTIFLVFFGIIFYLFYLRAYSNRQLFTTAFIDRLTGANNFNRMCELFPEKLAEMKGSAALVVTDITRFKVINDLHGYERGNQVLQRMARIIRENISEPEIFCRAAADNFILLLQYDTQKSLAARLNNLATQIRRDCTVADSCIMIDVAYGIYEIKENIPFYIMLDRAHLALDNAKRSSVAKCEFYNDEDRQKILVEKQIENAMEGGMSNGEFEVYLQPKCDFMTGQMKGAEALVRWNRPGQGAVRPDDFIPVFEKNGFILRLDMFVLQEVCALLAKWKAAGIPQVPLAVNFSRLHLNDSRYLSQMASVADTYGVDHSLIEVEITESVIFNNLERVQSVMQGLHERGFSVAMDDFGSGYSSLNMLKNLKFDSIKMDKEFLAHFENNPYTKKVIQGTVSMIKALGVKVVAEGVETREQAGFLQKIGCDLAQGYLFSKPLTISAFEQRLLNGEKNNLP